MRKPLSYRHNIPFYTDKSAAEFQKDPYERYDPMVIRQSAIHLADHIWDTAPYGPIYTFAEQHYPTSMTSILEIGCGVGRWIGDLAKKYPTSDCYGIDYSYQMLKRAHEYWINGNEVSIDLSDKGYPTPIILQSHKLSNLNLGLAKASNLPFEDESQDMIINSFLLDRLEQPIIALKEMYRVLRSDGTIIITTPLNFNQSKQWDTLYPPDKLKGVFVDIGFDIIEWRTDIYVNEPLDFHGNHINWKCLCIAARKLSR